MEGNTINSFENLCRIFEMRIKLDKEKGTKSPIDVIDNYEKYSKKIDSIHNSEFQKQLKSLISPAVTIEKEEDRLKRLIRLLEERLDKRIELEDRFYNSTGKYISGLQIIVSEGELEEKKERLSLISNYLETNREINNVTESLIKLKKSLASEEEKKEQYETKNKILEDELYSNFINTIKEDDYLKNINEEDINNELESIRGKVSETKETLDITKESIGSLINNGLEEDYTSYVEEAEKNYYNYQNREIILKIYKLIITFENDFKLMCSKREKISTLLEEKKLLRESLSIETDDELLSFEKTLLLQVKTLDEMREVLENIANYTSRIEFKEERLEELNVLNNSAEILVILREYGLVDTYDIEEIKDNIEEESLDEITKEIELPKLEESISETVYDPYRIIEVKDYPKTLNLGLAKLKGESVREKVNKKLNPSVVDLSNLVEETIDDELVNSTSIEDVPNKEETNNVTDEIINTSNEIIEESSTQNNTEKSTSEEKVAETPVWNIPSETESINNNIETEVSSNLPMWEVIKPTLEIPRQENIEDISTINITSSTDENVSNNMFWVPVSDSKLETKDFPTLNIPVNSNFNENNNFTFPTINN